MQLKRPIVEFLIKMKYGFRLNKPILMLRIIKKYFDIKILRKKPFKYVDVAFDYRCNLKCEHCFARKFLKPAGSTNIRKMTLEDHKKFAKEAMKLGATSFCFQGGEPLLPNLSTTLESLIKTYEPNKNFISITTNGTYMNNRIMKNFKRIGVDLLTVSIDSGIPKEHDKFRGMKGTFKKAMKTIDIALKNGLNVSINTTISHKNIHSEGFRKIIDFSEKCKIFLNPILATPVGAWEGNKNIVLTEDDLEYLEELRRKHPFLRRDVDANFVEWGCGAVKEALYLTAYGDILPCPFIHISLGNVLKEPLEKIRKRGLKIKYFDHYHKKCLAGEDRDFMIKYASIMRNRRQLPINYSKVSRRFKIFWC